MSTDNIRRILDLADDIDLREGKRAYHQYHRMMTELAEHYRFPVTSVTAAFVALSPNNDYLKNLRSTVTILWGLRNGIEPDRIRASTYTHCKLRALRFAQGEDFWKVTKKSSRKTRAFYYNILHPWSRKGPVTVDGHLVNLWFGRSPIPLKQVAWTKKHWKYSQIEDDLRRVAQDSKLRPNQLQGILWFAWKRLHRIHYDPNLNLFERDNHWRAYIPPLEIAPYPVMPEGWLTEHLSRGRDKIGQYCQWPTLFSPTRRADGIYSDARIEGYLRPSRDVSEPGRMACF